MRLAARNVGPGRDDEGLQVDGYVVERLLDGHAGAEHRYSVRGPDGRPATLLTGNRPYADRRERLHFRRLARRRIELEHPAVIVVHAAGEHAGHPHLVAEPYPERTFADLLEREAPLAPERVMSMLAPVADALDHAHAHGLVHESLSGTSLLVGDDGRLMLDSFGVLPREDYAGWAMVNARDLHYRSPEELRGEPFEREANLYSLTALIVHALTGEPPYSGDRPAVAYSQLADAPPRVSERVPALGREIDAVVDRGMAKDPAERPASATELLREVAAALGLSAPAIAERPSSNGAAPEARPPRAGAGARIPLARTALVIAVAALCGAAAAALLDPFGDGSPDQTARPAAEALRSGLADRRVELRAELASAGTPQAQAASATNLAEAYDGAARSAGPPRLTAAARDAAAAYAQLAAAAEAHDEAAFAAARDAVTEAERRLVILSRR